MLAQTSLAKEALREAGGLLTPRHQTPAPSSRCQIRPCASYPRRDEIYFGTTSERHDTTRDLLVRLVLRSAVARPPYGIRGLSQPIGYSEDTYWKYTNPAGQGTFSILLTYMTRPIHPTPRRPRRGGSGFRVGASPRPPTDPSMWPGPASQPCLVVVCWWSQAGEQGAAGGAAFGRAHLTASARQRAGYAGWPRRAGGGRRTAQISTDAASAPGSSCFGVTVVKLLPVT